MIRGLGLMIWGSFNWIVRRLVRVGILRARHLGVRTISVGNLQAGGAGKSPLVAEIAQQAISRGRVVCVLTRGYGGSASAEGKVLRPGESASPFLVGDEPAWLRERVPAAWIAVGKDRVRSFGRASALARVLGKPIDLVILDDGFQHWKIRSDVHVVAVTGKSWKNRLFREFPSEVRWAQLIVGTREGVEAPVCVSWKPVISEPGPFHLITGVADPAYVEKSLKDAGVSVVKHTRFKDHHAYRLEECQRLGQGERVLLTEKDAIKWRALGIPGSSFSVIKRELKWDRGRDLWERVLWG